MHVCITEQVMQTATVFPIEVDLSEKTFNYNPSGQINDGISDDEEQESAGGKSRSLAVSKTEATATGGAAAAAGVELLDLS